MVAAYKTPLTLSDLQSVVRNLVLERTGDNGLVTATELIEIINLAARTIWMRIVSKYPDVFAQRSAANQTITTNSLPFTSIVTGGGAAGNIYRILNVLVGAVGALENALVHINEFSRASDRHVYEAGNGVSASGLMARPAIPYRWYVEGTTIYFTPITTGNFDARFQWVQQPKDMVDGTDTCWEGKLATFHDAVSLLATAFVFAKDSHLKTPIDPTLAYVDQLISAEFGPPQNPYGETPTARRP